MSDNKSSQKAHEKRVFNDVINLSLASGGYKKKAALKLSGAINSDEERISEHHRLRLVHILSGRRWEQDRPWREDANDRRHFPREACCDLREDLRHRQGWNRMEIRTALRTRGCDLHIRGRTQVQWRYEKRRNHDRHEPDDREGLKHTGTERVGLPDPLRPDSQEPGILNLRWTEN